jgi:hypothetical protein
MCPACHAWSPHKDWYHETLPQEKLEEETMLTALLEI